MNDRELLDAIYKLLAIGVTLGFIILAVASVLLVIGIVATRRAARYEDDMKATLTDVADLLPIVKAWAMSARTGASDSRDAVNRIEEHVKAAPDAERHVIEAVSRVPDQTAEKVVEKLDEIKRLIIAPLALAAIFGGSAVATPRATAADELRQRNAVKALTLAGSPADNR